MDTKSLLAACYVERNMEIFGYGGTLYTSSVASTPSAGPEESPVDPAALLGLAAAAQGWGSLIPGNRFPAGGVLSTGLKFSHTKANCDRGSQLSRLKVSRAGAMCVDEFKL